MDVKPAAGSPPRVKKKMGRRERLFLAFATPLIVLLLTGLWAWVTGGFVPSDLDNWIGVSAAILGGVLGLVMAWKTPQESFRNGKLLNRSKLTRIPLTVFGVASSFYISGSLATGWLAVTAFGQEGHRVATVSGWREGGRYTCHGPDIAEEPLSWICLNRSAEAIFPVGTKVVLQGRSTALGMIVERVVLDQLSPREPKAG